MLILRVVYINHYRIESNHTEGKDIQYFNPKVNLWQRKLKK